MCWRALYELYVSALSFSFLYGICCTITQHVPYRKEKLINSLAYARRDGQMGVAMKFHVLTLFPEMVEQGLHQSILGRAAEKGQLTFHMVNIREYTRDKHGKVDDYPYGGGAGMLMQAQPIYDAYLSVAAEISRAQEGSDTDGCAKPTGYLEGRRIRTVYVTPQGRTFTQEMARELAQEKELVFLCGHYEGIDERVLTEIVTDYISLGDYVLTGGELPAMVMIDAIARLVPGVLHNGESAETESFHNHLLEYPQYSRPEVWHGKPVPEVLLSGNHKKIEAWRLEQSLERTRQRRPDLYARYQNQQAIIWELSRQKRKYIHLMELLARGKARIAFRQGKNMLVRVENTQSYALYVESADVAGMLPELKAGWLPDQELMKLAVCQKAVKDLLIVQYGLKLRKTCYQACFTRKESLRVEYRDIRPLGETDLEYAAERYNICGKTYLQRRIQAGAVHGIYIRQGEKMLLAGFIGVHENGSMGMLYVDQAYRRQGLAASLESWLINYHLKRGEIPFCQIGEENVPAIRLQEKLGLYLCSEPMWWLEKDIIA